MPGFTKIKVTSWLRSTQIFHFLGRINLPSPFPRALCALQPVGPEQNTQQGQPGGPRDPETKPLPEHEAEKQNPNAGHETSHGAVRAACSHLCVQSPAFGKLIAQKAPSQHNGATCLVLPACPRA